MDLKFLEIGSNDGYLLKKFKKNKMHVLELMPLQNDKNCKCNKKFEH